MTIPNHPRRIGAALLFALSALACVPAHAALSPQSATQRMQPAANCQPAREYPNLRVRESEMDNIGSTNAYVICELMPPLWQYGSNEVDFLNAYLTGVSLVELRFHNAGTTAATIECNLQDSLAGPAPVPTRKAGVTLEPGASGAISYQPIGQPAFPGAIELSRAAAQCILPPNTSLTNTRVDFSFDAELP